MEVELDRMDLGDALCIAKGAQGLGPGTLLLAYISFSLQRKEREVSLYIVLAECLRIPGVFEGAPFHVCQAIGPRPIGFDDQKWAFPFVP